MCLCAASRLGVAGLACASLLRAFPLLGLPSRRAHRVAECGFGSDGVEALLRLIGAHAGAAIEGGEVAVGGVVSTCRCRSAPTALVSTASWPLPSWMVALLSNNVA